MYLMPQPYKCVKCGHEFHFTPHQSHPGPILSEQVKGERGEYTRYMPTCPHCYAAFIREHIGLGYCTTQWTEDGSEYDRARGQT